MPVENMEKLWPMDRMPIFKRVYTSRIRIRFSLLINKNSVKFIYFDIIARGAFLFSLIFARVLHAIFGRWNNE